MAVALATVQLEDECDAPEVLLRTRHACNIRDLTPPEQRLQDALERLRTTPFPEDSSTSEQLSELHAELAEYDGHVAGVVSLVLGGSQVEPGLLLHHHALRSRLELLVANAEDPVRSEARQHLAYCVRLDALLDVAQELVGR